MSSPPRDGQLPAAQFLGACLLLGEISDERQFETFTVKGVDHHNEPEDEERETHHRPQDQIDQTDEGHPANHMENDIGCNPGNTRENGLPGVEAHEGVLEENPKARNCQAGFQGIPIPVNCGHLPARNRFAFRPQRYPGAKAFDSEERGRPRVVAIPSLGQLLVTCKRSSPLSGCRADRDSNGTQKLDQHWTLIAMGRYLLMNYLDLPGLPGTSSCFCRHSRQS